MPLLLELYVELLAVSSPHASTVQNVLFLAPVRRWSWLLAVHALLFSLLFALYPYSSALRNGLFFHAWRRRLAGLFYMELLIRWVPALRRRFLQPFYHVLSVDAQLSELAASPYYRESSVRHAGGTQPLPEALPALRGQAIIEGDSGLGKSMFLRYMVSQAHAAGRVATFLPARECGAGVIEAILARVGTLAPVALTLHSLESLVRAGGIDVCIDGLNEVVPDSRQQVIEFLRRFPRANVLIGTQKIEWTPPPTARHYQLQSLRPEQMKDFLMAHAGHFPDSLVTAQEFSEDCTAFVDRAVAAERQGQAAPISLTVLSNPMDLSVVARMIASQVEPDLLKLQQQEYDLMRLDYEAACAAPFPLSDFAEAAMQLRLADQMALPEEFCVTHVQAVTCMERHRLLLRQVALDGTALWVFRHDKIVDFLIMQTFLGRDNTRVDRYLDDSRFKGVYLMLAVNLPLAEAALLREVLIDRAADRGEHVVSDAFIKILRERRRQPAPGSGEAPKPLRLFYSYAPEDQELLGELEAHLKVLKKQGVLEDWHSGALLPGAPRAAETPAQARCRTCGSPTGT